jgi:hypothetical protein
MSDRFEHNDSSRPESPLADGFPKTHPGRLRWKSVAIAFAIFAAGALLGLGLGRLDPGLLGARWSQPSERIPPPPADAVNIAVENRTGVDLRNVMVNDEDFGDIGAGTTSPLHTMRHMHRYAAVKVETPSGPMQIMPTDYVGERVLERGAYTYVLTISDGRLLMECVIAM